MLAESDALHARVLAFVSETSTESFEELALAIARFQAEHSPGYARLLRLHGSKLDAVESIVGVPSDAFRLARVAVHPENLDVARFRTSGTTAHETGIHPFRTLETYRTLSLCSGKEALFARARERPVVIAVAKKPEAQPISSLGHMMGLFMGAFGAEPPPNSWLLSDDGVDLAGLRTAAAIARERERPLVMLSTSFGLVALLDALGTERLELPADSLVMYTGGFKGRTREVELSTLLGQVAAAFGIATSRIVGEYGMTELTSQLYERVDDGGAPRGIYLEPRWLRVIPVDPATLEPVSDGEVGIAKFLDLGNVDSAISVVTQDLVRRTPLGIELLGRRPGAPARGCSLAVEGFLVPRV